MTAHRVVLCPIDFSSASERSIQLATQVASRFGGKLVFQHDMEAQPPAFMGMTWMYSETHGKDEEKAGTRVERMMRELLSKIPAERRAEGKLTRGRKDEAILLLANEVRADLIVMATHGRSTSEHKSLTERIVAGASCPVLATHDESLEPEAPDLGDASKPITTVVPLDFSPHAEQALRYASTLAAVFPLKLHLLHVEPSPSWGEMVNAPETRIPERRQKRLEEAWARLKAMVPPEIAGKADLEVRLGSPVEEIVDYSCRQGAGLIIMGVHHKGLIAKLLFGATSCGVLHGSKCPVWYVPAGWASQPQAVGVTGPAVPA